MSLTNAAFISILEDTSKCIQGDITWSEDEDRSPVWKFQVDVESSAGWPLFIQGSYNKPARSLTYALILKTEGRIYGLDLGKDHHNPHCNQIGEKHMHRWSEQYRDKEAYVPGGITAPVSDPVAVWKEFCAEARIEHNGNLNHPPYQQGELFE